MPSLSDAEAVKEHSQHTIGVEFSSRTVKLGEDLEPFVGPPATVVPVEDVKPAKGKKKGGSKKKPRDVPSPRLLG